MQLNINNSRRHEKSFQKEYIIPETLTRLKVLVVDDNSTFCLTMKRYLEEFGFTVQTINSGVKAIQLIENSIENKKHPFDLMFIDWQMPQLNGIDTFKKLHKQFKQEKIPKIILVTGFGREDVMKQAKDIPLDGFLLKPVTQSLLINSVMEVFDQDIDRESRHNLLESLIPEGFDSIRGAKILVVEDNAVNQQVVTEILEGEGFFVSIASNGKIALEKIQEATQNQMFDVILMDLQMPVMDGYMAAKEIRQKNYLSDLPIIAITADAMSGIQEKTAIFGMDDYITKPIDPRELFETLLKWIKPGKRILPDGFEQLKKEALQSDEPLPDLPGIDVQNGVLRIGGSVRRYKEMLAKFVENQSNVDEKIQQAIDSGNNETSLRLAHTLKGVSANVGAIDLHALAKRVESCLEDKNASQINTALKELTILLRHTFQVIRSVIDATDHPIQTENVEIDPNDLAQRIKKIQQCLVDWDMDAQSVLDDICQFVSGSAYADSFDHVSRYVKDYDYEKALAELNKIIQDNDILI